MCHVPLRFVSAGLSAGRVQSCGLSLITEVCLLSRCTFLMEDACTVCADVSACVLTYRTHAYYPHVPHARCSLFLSRAIFLHSFANYAIFRIFELTRGASVQIVDNVDNGIGSTSAREAAMEVRQFTVLLAARIAD
jgi:hypothetical protein